MALDGALLDDDAAEDDPDALLSPRTRVERWSDTPGYRAMTGRPRVASILAIKLDHIGDFVLSLDALLALRAAFPSARLELACAPWNRELALALGLFDAVHGVAFFAPRADAPQPAFSPAMLAGLAGRRWDLAIDLRVDADTRVLLRHLEARFKVGFDSPADDAVLTLSLPRPRPSAEPASIGAHQSLTMLRLVRAAADLLNPADTVGELLLARLRPPPGFDLSRAAGRFLVACNTSSGRAVKNWPLERFTRLIAWLARGLDAVVLLLGGADQIEQTAELRRRCDSANVLSAVGQARLDQAAGLIARASLFIGNDSGLTHIAARLGIPVVALFSGVEPADVWAPAGRHVTVLRARTPCSPCHIVLERDCVGRHACVLDISEAAVRAAVRHHLFTATRFSEPAPATPAAPPGRPGG